MTTTCGTCGRDVHAPYRRVIDGRIVEGCISRAHDGQLSGESLAWHVRPAAVAFRESCAKQEARTFGHALTDLREAPCS